MPTQKKQQMVEALGEKLKDTNGVILTEYQGMTVAEISELRAKLRALSCEYTVVKNTLASIALKNLGMEEFAKKFTGPTAIAINRGDTVGATKVLVDYTKDHAKLKLMAGFMDGKVLSAAEVKQLSTIPPKNVLIGKMLGSLQAPMYGLVNVLQANIRSIVYAIDAVKKQKEATPAS
jgi:large subunit ribosomal protein L10